jgi:hypothetical protein
MEGNGVAPEVGSAVRFGSSRGFSRGTFDEAFDEVDSTFPQIGSYIGVYRRLLRFGAGVSGMTNFV